MLTTKIWVDDIRSSPDGFLHIYSVDEFISLWKSGFPISLVSLDHDAGGYEKEGGDYIRILDFLEGEKNSKNVKFHIHSANPVGVSNMRRIINKNGWKEIYTLN